MSKTALKKELKNYSAEQLIELICEAYDAKVTSKEYFEFFLNPDVDKLVDKVWAAIEKELVRVKRRAARFRISRIRAQLELLNVYKVDADLRVQVWLKTIATAMRLSCGCRFSEAQRKSLMRLLSDFVAMCDRNELLVKYYDELLAALSPSPSGWENRSFRAEMRRVVEDYDPMSTL